jgi:pilus assembly protein Flp/PilA
LAPDVPAIAVSASLERHTQETEMSLITRLLTEEEGADATEYALLAALIAIALILGAQALGGKINNVFNNVQGNL